MPGHSGARLATGLSATQSGRWRLLSWARWVPRDVGPGPNCGWTSCRRGHSLTCTHDLVPCVLDAALHVPQALDVPVGRTQVWPHRLPVREQDGRYTQKDAVSPTWGPVPEPQTPSSHCAAHPQALCPHLVPRGLRASPGRPGCLPPWVHSVSTHRTALMCSQDAVPDRGTLLLLVRPWTVSN